MEKNKGFTLIEIMMVVFIIGLLASIIVISVSMARGKGRDAKRKADIDSLRTAIEMYADSNQKYPSFPGVPPVPADATGGDVSKLIVDASGTYNGPLAPYLERVPHDPKWPADTTQDYQYVKASQPEYGYGLEVTMEDGKSCKTGMRMNPNWWKVGGVELANCDF